MNKERKKERKKEKIKRQFVTVNQKTKGCQEE